MEASLFSKPYFITFKQAKIVLQIKDGVIVAEFYGLREAAESINKSASHIGECCVSKRKRAYGYKWKYKE